MHRQLTVKRAPSRFLCADCSADTSDLDEYYMLQPDVWHTVADLEMLCIGCVEHRLGRTLAADDFLPCPLNFDPWHERSDRLVDRMTRPWPDWVDDPIPPGVPSKPPLTCHDLVVSCPPRAYPGTPSSSAGTRSSALGGSLRRRRLRSDERQAATPGVVL